MRRTAFCTGHLPLAVLLLTLLPLPGGRRLEAQPPIDADPFGQAPPATPAPPPAPAETPPTAAAAQETAEEQDAVILTLIESNPTTPVELMRAIQITLDKGRTVQAKEYLKKLLEARPSAADWVALHRQFGSTLFLRISAEQQLQPEGELLGSAVLAAAHQAARNRARLAELVGQLSDANPAVRHAAVVDLRATGEEAVAVLVEALADSNRSAEHRGVRAGLVALGRLAVAPLIGALETPDPQLQAQVILALGDLKDSQVVPYLIRPLLDPASPPAVREASETAIDRLVGQRPSAGDAQRYLQRRVSNYLAGTPPREPDHEGLIELWQWDEGLRASVPARYTAEEASFIVASRLSRDLYRLAPESRTNRRLALLTNLQAAKLLHGLDRPLPQGESTVRSLAGSLGVEAIEDALQEAIRLNYIPAATGAVEVLADIGSEELLYKADGRYSQLVIAVQHSDRRLRFAAMQTILQLDPPRGFPGASLVPETLGYFAGSAGERRALIGHPKLDEAQNLVAWLYQLGITADAASTGRELFQLAKNQPDYEFILLHDAIGSPGLKELVQSLRHEPHTAKLPVQIMAREERVNWARDFAELDPLTQSSPRPQNVAALSRDIEQLGGVLGYDQVPFTERLQQAGTALDWLGRLAEQPRKYAYYDLMRQQDRLRLALGAPQLSAKAAHVLGCLGSPQAQQSLITLASDSGVPLSDRQAAVSALDNAVREHGLLLTTAEILLQYELYNQSASLDPASRKVLGSILDTIELPSQRSRAAR